jgi:hypothetical protein
MSEELLDARTLFTRLHARPGVKIDGKMYWRVEGDMLLDEDELRAYAQQRAALAVAQAAARDAGRGLVAMVHLVGTTDTGKIIRWAPGVELSYTVLQKTFAKGRNAGYELAVDSIRRAVDDWMATCGVQFTHKPELDDSDSLRPPGALFVVREFDAGGEFIAAAFFPTDPVERRHVLVDPSFYSQSLSFDRVGVFRHELGHVLGFRHEHIVSGKPPGCPDEDTYGTIHLTDYDAKSVMHYFCGGLGSKSLAITEKDRTAAQGVYGPPLGEFHFLR